MEGKGFRIGDYYFMPRKDGIAVTQVDEPKEKENDGMQLDHIRRLERKALRDLSNEVREISPDDVVKIIVELRRLRQENGQLKSEVSGLKEQVREFIPRRRVRRIYQQVKKILEQDGITDDLDIEE